QNLLPLSPTTSLFFFQAEDGIRDFHVTGVQTCALPISYGLGGDDAYGGPHVHQPAYGQIAAVATGAHAVAGAAGEDRADVHLLRSEERRVGEGGKSRGAACTEGERDV